MTDLIDADHRTASATATGHPLPLDQVGSDDTPTTEIPVIAPGAPAAPPAATLPPPTMTARATPLLPPPPAVAGTSATVAQAPSATADAPPSDPAPPPPVTPPEPAQPPAPANAPPAEPGPALVTGPAAILSADPAYAPLDQSVPALPPATAVAPTNTAAAAKTTGPANPLTLEELLGQQPNAQKPLKHGSAAGRFFKRLILLAMLAGAGYAAYTYGPGLYEEYTGADTESTAIDAPDEVDAPLAFPTATPAPTPIRTAEFILEGLPGAPEMSYQVTTDFETNVSQVDITRPNGPDLQILTYGEAALIRKAGEDQWYQLERGRFPLDDRLERADWVRQLDELLPTAIRSSVTIDDAGETTVSGVPTRRLSLTLDVSLLGGPQAPTPADPAAPPVAPPADAAAPPADAAAPPVDPATPPAAAGTTSLTTNIQVWVDAEGLVRKVSGVPELGAETITVVRTDGNAWVPDYPAPEFVQPLTAATLVELGI